MPRRCLRRCGRRVGSRLARAAQRLGEHLLTPEHPRVGGGLRSRRRRACAARIVERLREITDMNQCMREITVRNEREFSCGSERLLVVFSDLGQDR
jgi:hypothetical protein